MAVDPDQLLYTYITTDIPAYTVILHEYIYIYICVTYQTKVNIIIMKVHFFFYNTWCPQIVI